MIDIICQNKTGSHRLHLKIDTGSSGNTLPLRALKQMYKDNRNAALKPTTARLTAYNGSDIHLNDLKQLYTQQFDKIGIFRGEAVLHLKEDANPSIDAPRKCSVHIKQKIKKELDEMEKQFIIRKIQHHTDWCSSITSVLKKDGSIRICIDPKQLNQNLKRCPHKLPTLEELNPAFSQAKYFSKLDAKAGYWSVHLAKKSQELTTFRTPFGRYCFQRLPFGLSVSQDVFQQHMDRIINQADGCVCIAVIGRSEEEHDRNLHNLLETARRGLVFKNHQHALDEIRKAITAEACLQYYNPNKATILEVDASQKGLGACILQNGKAVAFASKSLSPAQANYSNIERETLALVFGINRFHTYLFGKEFLVETDHKPLEMIWKKPLTSTPPRLQRQLIKIQGYDCTIKYKPGSLMVLSDTLSRLPNPSKTQDVPIKLEVDDIEDTLNTDLMSFATSKQEELQNETSNDRVLQTLWQIVIAGWPENIKQVPEDIRVFWPYRDEIGISNGVMFNGIRVIIPKNLQTNILEQLHQGRMGIERTRRLARETVYWSGIDKDIERAIKLCQPCQEHQPSQHKEPLEPHDIPTTPWTKLSADLFSIGKDDYIVITDYYSKYPIVHKLNITSSTTIARIVSGTMSLFGAPAEIVSDNGPQYSGQPFKEMYRNWGVKHTTSSPRYPCSNRLAERTVRTLKSLIKKCTQTRQSIQVALLHLRATPIGPGLPSPAEMMFGRLVRTTLPSHHLSEVIKHQKCMISLYQDSRK
ncbi:uncharacterized protein LOC117124300 [Anneissia japonica]|uniref:uncharacterized protein LOC117124300 n=1 Tax=Anneissia japonica TaxID=1529436 RepID=UPI0014256A65|nr:uncharacterized protein LOC117124300 [Anneissia japonica]